MNASFKRPLALALALCMLLLSACAGGNGASSSMPSSEPSSSPSSEPSSNPGDDTRTVTDNIGNEVTVPARIDRIAIISTMPLASVYCMVAGDAKKLVALTPSSKNAAVTSFLSLVAPELTDASTAFSQGGAVNVEEVIGLAPDVVFYNTNNQGDAEAAADLTAAGIPCVGFSTSLAGGSTIETVNAWVTLLGQVLGEELQAEAIVDYGRSVEQMVAERVAGIPEGERKSALILTNYNASGITAAGSTFGRYWLKTIGADNVALEIEQAVGIVNLEQVYAWDPDVIFLNSFSAFTAEDLLNNTAVEGHDWSGLTAVQNGDVYKMPLGMYYWFPPCSDSPLALQWLAKHLYPELFEDIDMDQTILDYYQEFYGVTLTAEQLDALYNPPPESAMNT